MSSILSYLRSLYDLDTLDTRFTTSSSTPYQAVIDSRSDPSDPKTARIAPSTFNTDGKPLAQPSKWRTPEFYFYYFVFLTVVPYMFWVPYSVSGPNDPNYHKYEKLLSPGWVPGRKIDLSDPQYETFRENLPYLALLLFFQPLGRRLYNRIRPTRAEARQSQSPRTYSKAFDTVAGGEDRLEQRASYDFGFALILLAALHGFSALKVFLILYANFMIGTRLPRKYVPLATWTFNIATLFLNELNDGYRFATIADRLSGAGVDGQKSSLHNLGAWMDSYGGIMSRWEILFNITVLRLISFNMDYYWSLGQRGGNAIEKKQLDPANLSDKDRVATPAAASEYNFRNYFSYAIYAPLYLAGPIITFNDYVSQCKYKATSIETPRTIKYGVRFLLVLLCMELVLHFNYCIALSKSNPNWSDYTATQLCLLSFFNLHTVWLKLLLPFRLFRLWSLIDGIDPPENMLRCMSDNYSVSGFWRSWHRSYNKWLIRYLYVPLGGSSSQGNFGIARSLFNYIVVFTFVALWHDIQLNLLIWGWLVAVFMFPEVLARYLFPRKRWLNNLEAYRVLSGLGAVVNILLMLVANTVGFTVGIDGLGSIVRAVFKDWTGIFFLATVWAILFVGVQVMFELRESEMRKGINLRC